MKRVETSKKILIAQGVVAVVVVVFTLVMVCITRELAPLAYLIPAVAAEVSVGTGFYYAKAKAENTLKLRIEAKKEGLKDETDLNEIY